jgi:hypothetical protein
MNTNKKIDLANANNGFRCHHRNDDIPSLLDIFKMVTFNKLPSFWQAMYRILCILQINKIW